MSTILLKRAYDAASPSDGYRVYVDRLWPRGLSHADFPYDWWDKDIAPSDELRTWFHHDPSATWAEFERRYAAQLKGSDALRQLQDAIADKPTVTLLYSSHDELHNNAVVLKDVLKNK